MMLFWLFLYTIRLGGSEIQSSVGCPTPLESLGGAPAPVLAAEDRQHSPAKPEETRKTGTGQSDKRERGKHA